MLGRAAYDRVCGGAIAQNLLRSVVLKAESTVVMLSDCCLDAEKPSGWSTIGSDFSPEADRFSIRQFLVT